MGKLHALRPGTERTPEREALAAAIAERKSALDEIEAVEKALQNAATAERDALHVHARAAAAIETAKEHAADHATATLLGTAGAAPASIRQARIAAEDAEDALATARATRDALKKRFASLTEHNPQVLKKMKVDDAIRAVIRAEVDGARIYENFVRAYHEFADARELLELMEDAGIACGEMKSYAPEPPPFDHPSRAAWTAAIAALATDADASLVI